MTSEEVYKQLEKEIIIGIIKPKERLVEAEICQRLKVSRTLIREVFRRIEGVGLITLNSNRGAVVRDFSPKEIEDAYYVRITLEKAAAPLIVKNIDSQKLKELKKLNKEFERACRRHDLTAMIFANLAFHNILAQVSGNTFLCRFLEISRLQTHQGRYISWMEQRRIQESLQDHKEMLIALARKDLSMFKKIVLRHQEAGRKDYQRIFSIQRNWYEDSNNASCPSLERNVKSTKIQKSKSS